MTKPPILRLTLLVAGVMGVALAFFPLLGVHGAESALLLGLVLPAWVAASTASYARRLSQAGEVRGSDVMLRAIGLGLLVWLVPVLILALNALRVRQCTPLQGLTFMTLGPGLGCALAAATGVWVTVLLRGHRIGPWVAASIPLLGIAVGLWIFYSTPAVYVFNAFAGYFPGTIYDPIVEIPASYLSYRATTLIALMSLVLLFDAVWHPKRQQLDLRDQATSRPGSLCLALISLSAVLLVYSKGDELGHRASAAHIAGKLGRTVQGTACTAHMPRETPSELARRIVEDCDFHALRTSALAGVDPEAPVTAFFFRDADEKKALMGAGATYIAKPWRREAYLQMRQWPHPVLAHELVHAVLADAARPPFHVAARLLGLLPNPGLIEGAAVALAWDVREDLDPHQWARIMMDAQILPSAAELMSLRFTALPARRAYAAAGSLTSFLMESRGMDSFRRAYYRGQIAKLEELEAKWHSFLRDVDVSAADRGVAEVALAQKSVFTSVCPHRIAQLQEQLQLDVDAQDDVQLIDTCDAILDIEASHASAQAALVGAYARTGREQQAQETLRALELDERTPKPILASALEELADAAWDAGHGESARELYEELLAIPQSDDSARGREVKELAVDAADAQQTLIFELLVGRPSPAVAMHIAHKLSASRADGLGPYLAARQLMEQNRYDLALPLIEDAEGRGLATERLRRELQRMHGISLFGVGRYEDSSRIWKARLAARPASVAEARRWLERIALIEDRALSPQLPGSRSARRADP